MDLSIVIPVYNSEKIIENLVNQIINSVNDIKTINSYEIILVDDHSFDNSWNKIKLLSEKFNLVKGIKLAENFGQHNAIMCGLKECKGDKIITMDDDLQHPPSSIKDLINELNKGFDICYTKYLNRQHPLWKKIMSWINNFMASHLLNKPYNIYLSSYRAFQKKIVKEIINYDEPNVYIDGLVLKITRNISIVSVPHNQRLHGPSNYGFKKLLSLWSNMAINFPIFPLRISSIFGLIILSTIIIIRKISFPLKQETRLQYIIVEKTAND